MRDRLVLLFTVLIAIPVALGAQSAEVLQAYLPKQHEHAGNVLNYRILYPANFDAQKKYPLVIFLHGRGESGNDNKRQLVHGSQLFLDSIARYPAIVIFPQCPESDYWANLHRPETGGASRTFTFYTGHAPAPSLAAVMSLIDTELSKPYIDEDRLYVAGLSMGGMGTWELLWRIPDKIAAAIPICGGGAPESADAMLDIPIWAIHGMKDDVVSPNLSIRMVRAIQQKGGLARITLFPEANHNSWDPAFADPEFLSWMFAQRNTGPSASSARVDALMDRMTIDEKIGQLNLVTQGGAVTGTVISEDVEAKIRNGQVGGIFGSRSASKMRRIQEIAVNDSRLGIPLLTAMDVIHGHQTVVPIPLALSCSWDPALIEECARMAAREATADGIMWNFSPMVDIARDPRWGRIAEGAGEDPYLGSRLAEAYVRGYQGQDLTDPTTMIACVKHFAAYGAPEAGRDYATVDMSAVRLFNE
ncbi:MAG: glycoside hydrolase family 3 N-terminal domain-containing protein, partial [Saprospiraceae bacterium]|nr:glycoside hydrolase family 3 N-terminal domain-containing protein [Saprospiraceae bacterium]